MSHTESRFVQQPRAAAAAAADGQRSNKRPRIHLQHHDQEDPPHIPHHHSPSHTQEPTGLLPTEEEYHGMSLQCAECGGNIADSKAGDKLSFCVDGTSLHLVMGASNEGRPGVGFKVLEVPPDKKPTEKNPYRSVSHVLCANARPDGEECRKKVGGVKNYPPLSDNRLIFFQRKALLVDHQRTDSWKTVRENSLRKVQLLPADKEEGERQFTPRQWPPLIRSLPPQPPPPPPPPPLAHGSQAAAGLTKTTPRGYQVELFCAVMECGSNSLVYLPTGLGKTLVASMVLKRLLDLNPGRQAYFLVETTALAMQQATQIQNELGGTVEMLVGSSLCCGKGGPYMKGDAGKKKLESVRKASIVVATAGAFEHSMCKNYIDPDSICCVVLDEAHHCGKEHPFNRVARSFLTMKAFPEVPATPERIGELPKLLALTASPAGELKLLDTIIRIEELLDRLGANLTAPVQHLQEVKRLTPSVHLALTNVTATEPETELLGCLEKLVLSRVARLAPEASEVRVQAQSLLDSLHARLRDAKNASITTAAIGADVPRKDDPWRFPNKFFTALCQRALTLSGGGGGGGRGGAAAVALSEDWESDRAASVVNKDNDPCQLYNLMNMSFAVDEIGGRSTWENVLGVLKRGRAYGGGGRSRAGGPTTGSSDDERDVEAAIGVLEKHLEAVSESESEPGSGGGGGSGSAAESEAEVAAGATPPSGVAGSKLAKIGRLLEQHRRECDESEKRFSALVFVSRRDLAQATSTMLEAAHPFVKAQAIVGLSEMTLNQQRVVLGSFRDGAKNVLVSTSVCGEGIDVPACALVVCASLPSSGTELVQLRGRIRSKEKGCRFVGLTRTSGKADQDHLDSICKREENMLEAIRCLSAGRSSRNFFENRAPAASVAGTFGTKSTTGKSGSSGSSGSSGKAASQAAVPGGAGFRPQSPTSDADTYYCSETSSSVITAASTMSSVGARSAGSAQEGAVRVGSSSSSSSSSSGAGAGAGAGAGVAAPSPSPSSGVAHGRAPSVEGLPGPQAPKVTVTPTMTMVEGKGDKALEEGGGVVEAAGGAAAAAAAAENPWKELPPTLTPAARRYAATYLATCVRQSLQRNPDQMARCTLNSAAQLAHTIKPVFGYDERKVKGCAQNLVMFEARCIVSSRLTELAGLILVKEARGHSIKAAREGAAVKVRQYLLSKDASTVQPLGSGSS